MRKFNAVKAIIVKDGKILYVRVDPAEAEDGIGWDLPGGKLQEGETEEEALSREVKEELSVEPVIIRKLSTWEFQVGEKVVYVQNYLCELTSYDIQLSKEHIEYKWVLPEDSKNYLVFGHYFHGGIYEFRKGD